MKKPIAVLTSLKILDIKMFGVNPGPTYSQTFSLLILNTIKMFIVIRPPLRPEFLVIFSVEAIPFVLSVFCCACLVICNL